MVGGTLVPPIVPVRDFRFCIGALSLRFSASARRWLERSKSGCHLPTLRARSGKKSYFTHKVRGTASLPGQTIMPV
jgi:hypothetical protein